VRGADLVLLMLDVGSDDGLQECRDVVKHFATTKTRLAATSHLDKHDVGLSFTRTFLVPNKMDLSDAPLRWSLFQESLAWDFSVYPVSSTTGVGLDMLKSAIFESLDVVRIYTKSPRSKDADYERPFTIRRGGTLGEIAEMIHKDLAANLKFARVWGSQVHDGTVVKADYVLHDGDVVELHES
jgi:ribosome-interacting GTPase 1